jgi:hypothetical protein
MIVLLSMGIVAADQCPCLTMCVIRHLSLSLTWWSIISLDFDFNQQDIRKRLDIQVKQKKEKNDELNDPRGKRNQSTNS